jgi:hypothetical protein
MEGSTSGVPRPRASAYSSCGMGREASAGGGGRSATAGQGRGGGGGRGRHVGAVQGLNSRTHLDVASAQPIERRPCLAGGRARGPGCQCCRPRPPHEPPRRSDGPQEHFWSYCGSGGPGCRTHAQGTRSPTTQLGDRLSIRILHHYCEWGRWGQGKSVGTTAGCAPAARRRADRAVNGGCRGGAGRSHPRQVIPDRRFTASYR